jgi:hypothetical protein
MPDLKTVSTEEWTAAINTANLTPGPTFGYRTTTGGWDVACHVALSDNLTDAARTEVIGALQASIGPTVRRVLGHSEAELIQQTNLADGTSTKVTANPTKPPLFGPNRQLLGYEDQDWAVWISGMDDIHDQPTSEMALAFAAEFNAGAYADYDGSPYSPVIYAIVLRHGYAWAPSVDHRAGRDCGLETCIHCGTDRNIAASHKAA